MKGFTLLAALCGVALLMAGCALPLGKDYYITRDGAGSLNYITDYNLQSYVPIPSAGERPVTASSSEGMDLTVTWKDAAGGDVPLPFDTFAADTVYGAEIRITAKPGYGFYSSIPFTYPSGKVSVQNDDLGDSTRMVTITYNNSDKADITYITDYLLQSYVPVPMTGDGPVTTIPNRADLTVTVSWAIEDPPDSSHFVPITTTPYTFVLGAVYQAEIELAVKPGYAFFPSRNFVYSDGTVIVPQGDATDPGVRRLTATYMAARNPQIVSEHNLTPYIPKPIDGVTPVISFANAQYTGAVIWKNTTTQTILTGTFQSGAAYTAELILTPALGYTFTGIGANWFIHTGAEAVTNSGGSGMVSINFSPVTGAGGLTVVYDTNLSGRIPKPANGMIPVVSFGGSQYTGTITWKDTYTQAVLNGPFHPGMAYTAVAVLSPVPGYTFDGIGQNRFLHKDASGVVTNPANSGTVLINFPVIPPSFGVTSFGPASATDSALKLMRNRVEDIYQLAIDLPSGSENIGSNITLVAGTNCPGNVVINGHNRVLKRLSPGMLFTVGAGVTLTLQNITLEGISGNNAPVVKVQSGGKLILGTGVILKGNRSTGDAGGIWVNGGELVLNSGAVIKNMKALRGGGVFIDDDGRFTMSGGTIGGESGEGNEALVSYSGSGVFVYDGTFTMYGGLIKSNRTAVSHSGGGVGINVGTFNLHGGTIEGNTSLGDTSGGGVGIVGTTANSAALGAFNQYGGTITGNTAIGYYAGGGVHLDGGIFTMNGATAVIENNTAEQQYSSGGVYTGFMNVGTGTFYLIEGTIQGNVAQRNNSGGGVGGYGRFTMTGGSVKNNTAKAASSGGGVYASSFNEFAMENGTIENNTAAEVDSGGGVYVEGRYNTFKIGAFTMTGGTIENNTVVKAASGGGVYVKGNFVMAGTAAVIADNTAEQPNSGGGVYVFGDARFAIYKGTIKENTAKKPNSGGGIRVATKGTLIMNDGTIENNTVEQPNSGGGVYVTSDGEFNMNNGIVKKNTAKAADSGGGLYLNGCKFTMDTAAVVEENIAEKDHSGGGIYVTSLSNSMPDGGTIKGNKAKDHHSGGGMYVAESFDMTNGTIIENVANGSYSGGGLAINGNDKSPASVSIKGGSIKKNQAMGEYSGGGAAIIGAHSSFSLTDGFIQENLAEDNYSGGGVAVFSGGYNAFHLTNGTIQKNDSSGHHSGGGVYTQGTFVMKANEVITENIVRKPDAAGGVYIGVEGSLEMEAGEIKGNENNGITENYGVYVTNNTNPKAFRIGGTAKVNTNNLVFLDPGAVINLDDLPGSGVVAAIRCSNPSSTTKLLYSGSAASINNQKDRFTVNGAVGDNHITDAVLDGSDYYGYYKP
ncbi:right-handed parallel beta-helix repeat-containing protein [Treponema sp. TIM-1]|uniref:hypothetical protein n=1 Tax=Treponema sp. TIM-1 TaxID=2898417 RepID=UPI003980A9AC